MLLRSELNKFLSPTYLKGYEDKNSIYIRHKTVRHAINVKQKC